MPELPEVETIMRGLSVGLAGRSISSVKVLRNASIAYPGVKSFVKQLSGHRIESLSRRGKYLLIHLDGNAGLGVHLRMSGCLLLTSKKEPPGAHLRVNIGLDNGQELRFEDMRVFGRIWYVGKGKNFTDIIPALQELGPEPLSDLSAQYLGQALATRRQAIKSCLLDQTLIAGVGNIYADESLHLAAIHPMRAGLSLKKAELERLVSTIRKVLLNAIELGGSTLRDYKNSDGVNGEYQHEAWVYGRTGLACRTCQSPIKRIKLGGRSSHFCPRCQKLPHRR
jgi:formamidopyrimidine-DNA glycosylase